MLRSFFLLLPFAAAFLMSCGPVKEVAENEVSYSPYHDVPEAEYVGLKNCTSCHEQEYEDWQKSDHHLAMNPATEEFVLGNFDNAEFDHFGQEFRFFRKGEEFWVNAQDEDGEYLKY